MRPLMMTASMLTVAWASPAFAQQTNVADRQMRQEAEAIVTQYADALNKGDAQAYAALFAPNAIDINPFGKFKNAGTQLQDSSGMVHKMGLTLTVKVDDVESICGGQGAVATAPYTGTFTNNPATPQVRGNLLFVLEHAGESWKIRAQTASRLATAAPAK